MHGDSVVYDLMHMALFWNIFCKGIQLCVLTYTGALFCMISSKGPYSARVMHHVLHDLMVGGPVVQEVGLIMRAIGQNPSEAEIQVRYILGSETEVK
jgi:hypothetical protein